jgi:hypothetical protein
MEHGLLHTLVLRCTNGMLWQGMHVFRWVPKGLSAGRSCYSQGLGMASHRPWAPAPALGARLAALAYLGASVLQIIL